MPNYNPNSTNYVHSFEPNTNDLVHAMDYNAAGQPIIRTVASTAGGNTLPSAGSITSWNEATAQPLNPIIQIEGQYGFDPDEVQTYTGGGGTANITGYNLMTASTSTTAYSYGVFRSRRNAKYRPGQGAMVRFTAAFNSAAGTTLRVGLANQEEAIQIGFNGTQFGIFHSYGGKAEIRTLAITGAPSSSANATIVLNSVSFSVPLVSGETVNQTAARIANFAFTGWITEQKDAEVRFLTAGGTGPLAGTYSFTHGTATGTFARTQTGVVATEVWTYQSDFNIDKLDGTGTSTVNIDFSKLNVFQMQYRWLGAGIRRYAIENPLNGDLIYFHQQIWSNQNTRTWVDNPGFKITYTAYNLGGTEVASLYGASMAAYIEGPIIRNNYTRSYSLQKTSLASGTVHHLFTIKNPTIYAGKINTKEIVLQDLVVSQQGNDPLQVFLFFEADLATGTQVYTRLPEAVAVISTVTGTVDLATYTPVSSFVVGIGGTTQFDLSHYRIVIPPGQRATVCVKSGQTIQQVTGAITWLAD